MTKPGRSTVTRLSLFACFALGTVACQGADDGIGPDSDAGCESGKCDDDEQTGETADAPRVCFGVRGNGERIFGHFGSLARIIEDHGLMWGGSGGSSGSITTFVSESINMNALVHECGGEACEAQQSADRAALLFKSLAAYAGVLEQSDTASALSTVAQLPSIISEHGLQGSVAEVDVAELREAILALQEAGLLGALGNEELVDLIETSPRPDFHVRDVAQALASLSEWAADNTGIFLRPGPIDFEKFGVLVGRLANFYTQTSVAGDVYAAGDATAWNDLMDSCATAGHGKGWAEIAALPTAGGSTCGGVFTKLVLDYRATLDDRGGLAERVEDRVGEGMHLLVSTSVLEGDAIGQWQDARADYMAGDPHTLEVDFDDVAFGYFGAPQDLEATGRNDHGYTDAKTARYRGLGQVTWRKALKYSPAEPGLTRAQEIEEDAEGRISAGGWSDLHPTLVLKNMGCEEVVYISRVGGASSFVVGNRDEAGDIPEDVTPSGVGTLLGMTKADYEALYDLSPEPDPARRSAYDLSLREADAVWCTNWNDIPGRDVAAIVDDAYNEATLVTEPDSYFDGSGYEHQVDKSAGILGCTPLQPPTGDYED